MKKEMCSAQIEEPNPMLNYSYIENPTTTSPPPRAVNGGLYTGQPAMGPWGNTPIVPETHIMIDAHYKLAGNTPPPQDMKYQAISTNRPGNNLVKFPHHIMCTNLKFNRLCAPPPK